MGSLISLLNIYVTRFILTWLIVAQLVLNYHGVTYLN